MTRTGQRPWDVHPDAERVALAARADAGPDTRQDKVVFIFNFFDELKRIAPSRQTTIGIRIRLGSQGR